MSKSFIVNAITFARLPLIFLWLAGAIAFEYTGAFVYVIFACVSMLLSGLTDLWDGRLARRWSVVSALGKMADPLMDKVFYLVAFPALTFLALHRGGEDFHALALLLFTIFYMLRDTWVTFLRSVGTMYGADVAAMWLGKVRTALSFPGAGWIYLYCALSPFAPESWRGIWLASCYVVEGALALLTLWSLYTYTAAYMPYLKRAIARE